MSRAGAVVVLSLWLASAVGAAQEAKPSDTVGAHTAADDQAKAAFDAGQKHYQQGEYALAAQAFREAYEHSAQPALLYNLAQAERLAGQCDQALAHYQAFVASSPGAVPADVNDKIAEMTQCAQPAETPAIAPAAAKPVGDPAHAAATATPVTSGNRGPGDDQRPSAHSRRPSWLGWTAAAVGAAGIVAGAVMGAMVVHRQSVVEDTCPDKRCRNQSGIDAADEGKKLLIGTVAAFGLGAAGIGVAVYVWADGSSQERADSRTASLRPGAVVTWSGAF